jgi:ABC-type branched-subunit amino acid transport system ATPase component
VPLNGDEASSCPVIEARQLSVGYGNIEIARNLDLVVNPGEVVALFGPNGAGKTTTLLTLSGELRSLGGEVRWLGAPSNAPLYSRARQGLGFVCEGRSVLADLSVRDNFKVSQSDIDFGLSLFPELRKRLRVRAGMLSGGEQQMLSLARILGRRPRLLLADELSLGLAPIVVGRLLAALRTVADDGVGVLLVEQHIRKAMAIADRAYVLSRGSIVMSGTASELSDLSRIERSYFSGSERGESYELYDSL